MKEIDLSDLNNTEFITFYLYEIERVNEFLTKRFENYSNEYKNITFIDKNFNKYIKIYANVNSYINIYKIYDDYTVYHLHFYDDVIKKTYNKYYMCDDVDGICSVIDKFLYEVTLLYINMNKGFISKYKFNTKIKKILGIDDGKPKSNLELFQ